MSNNSAELVIYSRLNNPHKRDCPTCGHEDTLVEVNRKRGTRKSDWLCQNCWYFVRESRPYKYTRRKRKNKPMSFIMPNERKVLLCAQYMNACEKVRPSLVAIQERIGMSIPDIAEILEESYRKGFVGFSLATPVMLTERGKQALFSKNRNKKQKPKRASA